MENLTEEIKESIIRQLNLKDINPDDINSDEPLFGDGLGLDSIDALELIVMLEKQYGIRLTSAAEAKEIFKSVAAIADYVEKNRKK